MMRHALFRSLLLAAFFVLGGLSPAHSQGYSILNYFPSSYTNIWTEDPDPQGGGWGVNFAQSGDFIFATFFVYDQNGAPKWYTGELKLLFIISDGSASFSCDPSPGYTLVPSPFAFCGPLYLTAGASATDMFTSSGAKTTAVGKAAFIPDSFSPTTGRLYVQLGDTLLTKNIRMLTLTAPEVGSSGGYATNMWIRHFSATSGDSQNPVTSLTFSFNEVKDGFLSLAFEDTGPLEAPGGSCLIIGPYSVEGSYYVVKNASYRCKKGPVVFSRDTTADLYLRFNQTGGMEGRWISKESNVYRDNASFSAIFQTPFQPQ